MSETEAHKTVGPDGLVEFDQYLTTLDQEQYREHTFDMPDGTGRRGHCSLDDVLRGFRDFFDGRTDTFSLGIDYVDYERGTIGRNDRTFTGRKQ